MREKVGLALAGGGIRGAYQIGAFYAFKKCGIKFSAMTGTSIGSFNAAMLVAHQERKLLHFWRNIDVTSYLELDPGLKDKGMSVKKFEALFKTVSSKVTNKGFNIKPLKDGIDTYLNQGRFKRSRINFGLVTLKGKNQMPVEITKKDIKKDKIIDYIAASCYLPIFKKEKMIDEDYYLDGGFYDNCPTYMLEKMGCTKIYAVRLKSIGVNRHRKMEGTRIINIEPSKNLGSILAIDNDLINRNIDMGYYDTMRVLKKLDGLDYYFENKDISYYEKFFSDLPDKEIKKYESLFRTKNKKKMVLRALEFILRKEKKEMYRIYKVRDIIKTIKKHGTGTSYQYMFIKKLRIGM